MGKKGPSWTVLPFWVWFIFSWFPSDTRESSPPPGKKDHKVECSGFQLNPASNSSLKRASRKAELVQLQRNIKKKGRPEPEEDPCQIIFNTEIWDRKRWIIEMTEDVPWEFHQQCLKGIGAAGDEKAELYNSCTDTKLHDYCSQHFIFKSYSWINTS